MLKLNLLNSVDFQQSKKLNELDPSITNLYVSHGHITHLPQNIETISLIECKYRINKDILHNGTYITVRSFIGHTSFENYEFLRIFPNLTNLDIISWYFDCSAIQTLQHLSLLSIQCQQTIDNLEIISNYKQLTSIRISPVDHVNFELPGHCLERCLIHANEYIDDQLDLTGFKNLKILDLVNIDISLEDEPVNSLIQLNLSCKYPIELHGIQHWTSIKTLCLITPGVYLDHKFALHALTNLESFGYNSNIESFDFAVLPPQTKDLILENVMGIDNPTHLSNLHNLKVVSKSLPLWVIGHDMTSLRKLYLKNSVDSIDLNSLLLGNLPNIENIVFELFVIGRLHTFARNAYLKEIAFVRCDINKSQKDMGLKLWTQQNVRFICKSCSQDLIQTVTINIPQRFRSSMKIIK